jgi:hypothetical protein
VSGYEPTYADLGHLPEDHRIGIIGGQAERGNTVGFFVENDAKADRYIEKLFQRFSVRLVTRRHLDLGGQDVVFVKVGPLEKEPLVE